MNSGKSNSLKIARRHMTPKEIKEHKSPFDSKYWLDQKERNVKKVEAQRLKKLNKKK